MPRTALLAGGTGLVGRRILAALEAEPAYARVVALARRPEPDAGKTTWRVVDFAKLAEADLPPVDDVFVALGTTMRKAGSHEAFRRVDHDHVLAAARAGRRRGAERLALVSSVGADPESRVFYSRVKGETERDVRALGFAAAHVFRPSILLGDRAERRPGERVGIVAARLLRPLLPARYRPTDADLLARAMVRAALDGGTGYRVYEGRAIADLAR